MENIDVFDGINKKKIRQIKKGETVAALTGEVHLIPMPFLIVTPSATEDSTQLKQGDVIYVLDYEGEGFSNAWYQNKSITVSWTLYDHSVKLSEADSQLLANSKDSKALLKIKADYLKACKNNPDLCKEDVWWVQIKQKNGKVGWVKSRKFQGSDSCG